jgi:hypothetical protein
MDAALNGHSRVLLKMEMSDCSDLNTTQRVKEDGYRIRMSQPQMQWQPEWMCESNRRELEYHRLSCISISKMRIISLNERLHRLSYGITTGASDPDWSS